MNNIQLHLPFEENKPKWHNIYCIKPNGEMEFAASYDGKFTAFYAMQLWWCYLHRCNFFCTENLKKAAEQIVVSKSLRSVMFDMGEDTYILTTKKDSDVRIGIGGCTEYEYNLKVAR